MQTALFDAGFETEAAPRKRQPKQKPEGDICARKHKGHARSVEAYEKNKEHLTKQEKRVLEFIEGKKARGATADEVSRALKISGQSSSARMAELKMKERIVETQLIRETQWGNRATVCVVPEYLEAANASATKEGK